MKCRDQCGACCIAPSISSPLPGMPEGKPAGVACINLDAQTYRCRIWGSASYPVVCRDFKPMNDSCGDDREQALRLIGEWEALTTA